MILLHTKVKEVGLSIKRINVKCLYKENLKRKNMFFCPVCGHTLDDMGMCANCGY